MTSLPRLNRPFRVAIAAAVLLAMAAPAVTLACQITGMADSSMQMTATGGQDEGPASDAGADDCTCERSADCGAEAASRATNCDGEVVRACCTVQQNLKQAVVQDSKEQDLGPLSVSVAHVPDPPVKIRPVRGATEPVRSSPAYGKAPLFLVFASLLI